MASFTPSAPSLYIMSDDVTQQTLDPTLDEKMIKQIIDHKYPDNDVDLFVRREFKIKQLNIEKEFLIDLSLCTDEEEKFDTFNEYIKVNSISPIYLQNFKKYNSWAKILRLKGNEQFNLKEIQSALRYYNLALVYAFKPIGLFETDRYAPFEYSLVLACRSSALLQLNEPAAALQDIQLAVKFGYAETDKLNQKKFKCVSKKVEMAKFSRDNPKFAAEQARRLDFCQNHIFKLKQPGEKMLMAEHFVKIEYDDLHGRKVIVTEDVPAGTVIIVEKPFVKFLHQTVLWDVGKCHNCFRVKYNPIPCPKCVFAVFCSEECSDKAWKLFHRYECACLPVWYFLQIPSYVLIAFKTICNVGPKRLYEIFKTKDPNFFRESPPEIDVYSSSSYLEYFHLGPQNSKFETRELKDVYTNAIQFVKVLSDYTCFFQYNEYDGKPNTNGNPESVQTEREQFKKFVIMTLIRHINSATCNLLYLTECDGLENVSLRRMGNDSNSVRILGAKFTSYGSAIYNLGCLISHSCDPNCSRINDQTDGVHSIYTLKHLKAGDEVTISYACNFLIETRFERQAFLEQSFAFKCECKACRENWPTWPGLRIKKGANKPKFLCQLCRNVLVDEAVLGYCEECGKHFSLLDTKYQLNVHLKNIKEAKELLVRNLALECIQLLVPALDFCHKHILYPFPDVCWAQEYLKRAYYLVLYYSDGKYF